MASIPRNIQRIIDDYVARVGKEIPIKRAVLFGSYAKGTFNEHSDIDLAIFSDHFEAMSRTDGISYLLMKAIEYNIDLEPIAFTGYEYDYRLGIVDEIIRDGIEV